MLQSAQPHHCVIRSLSGIMFLLCSHELLPGHMMLLHHRGCGHSRDGNI